MSTLKATLAVERGHPGWLFWLLFWLFWNVATWIGAILYGLPAGAVVILLGLDRIDPQQIKDLAPSFLVAASVLVGAACGSTIGLAQWLVLRRTLKRSGGWVLATLAGYASIGLLQLIGDLMQPGWLTWASTLISSGKMHWIARVQPEWAGSSWLPGAVTLTLFGTMLGIVQWLVLRGRVYQAGWWIVISAAGWAIAALLSMNSIEWATFVSAVFGAPVAITGVGLVWLLRRSPQHRTEPASSAP